MKYVCLKFYFRRKFTLTFTLPVKVIIQVWKSQRIDRCKKRRYHKDRKLTEFTDRIENVSVVGIIKQNGFYHREYYKTLWNLNEVKRAEKRFNGLIMVNNLRK